jgi:hypothetical protein
MDPASQDTGKEYPLHIILKTEKFHFFRVDHLEEALKIFVDEKKCASQYSLIY